MDKRGRLYLVATPIGNLGDLSPRAREVLASVDRILVEDTRRTGPLLARLAIDRPMLSLHEHNERARLAPILAELESGGRIALVSDAGTPAISDPGTMLVREAREAGIDVESVAGPSALAAALSASGFEAAPSLFLGFPPARSGERRRFLAPWIDLPATLVIYEAPHRIESTLGDLVELSGTGRKAILLRELTKIHEEGIDGTLGSIRDEVARREGVKGELVLVLAAPVVPAPNAAATGGEVDAAALRARVEEFGREGLARNEALRRAAKEIGLSRSEAYRLLLDTGKDESDDPAPTEDEEA